MILQELIQIIQNKADELLPGTAIEQTIYTTALADSTNDFLLTLDPLYCSDLVSPIDLTRVDSAYIQGRQRVYIPVPADYLRLVAIKFPEWRHAVTEAYTTPATPEYRRLDSKHLVGFARPAVRIITRWEPDMRKYFECGKVTRPNDEGEITEASYISSNNTFESLPQRYTDALSWLATAKIMGIKNEPQREQAALKYYQAAIALLQGRGIQ